MPAIVDSRSSAGLQNSTTSQISPMSGKSKRFNLLRHLKPGHKNNGNSNSNGPTTPTSPSPIKTTAAQPPPTSPTSRDRPTNSRNPSDLSKASSPRSPLTDPYNNGRTTSEKYINHNNPPSSSDKYVNNSNPPEIQNKHGNQRIDSAREAQFKANEAPVRPSPNRPMSDASSVSFATAASNDQSISSRQNVRFAAGVNTDQRPRRPSSSATASRRRSLIYAKADGGDYVEGVDLGAGTKARRLSVQFSTEIFVDEDRLEDYFDLLSRLGKKKIGEGGAASVQLMKSKKAGDDGSTVFAVKEFRPWDSEEEQESEYKRKIKSEFAISKSCQHPNIVHTFRLCCSGEEWFHVMEYCDLGDLNDLIAKQYFNQEDRNCLFKQLLRGVDYLHSRGIAHRDLKSENLLVNHHGCLKIADFGTSDVFCGQHPGSRNCRRPSIIDEDQEIRLCTPGMIGSRPYMAPEVVQRGSSYDPRCVDVWSCAIVYLTLCFHGTPWESASAEQNNYNIFCNSWDDWLERHPDGIIRKDGSLPSIAGSRMLRLETPGARTMVLGMLHPDPAHRWQIKDALEIVCEREGAGPWPCCQQDGYSDDIKTRERKALHNHIPPDKRKRNGGFAGK